MHDPGSKAPGGSAPQASAARDSIPRQGAPPQDAPPQSAPPKSAPLSEDERAELERLRAENSELRSGAGRPGGRPRRRPQGWWRGIVATILIIIGCVLAPLSVLAVWTSNQVSNTDRYVTNVAPLISQPPIQNALADKITTAIDGQINVQQVAQQAATGLSDRGFTRAGDLLSSFSGQIAGSVTGFIHGQVARFLASPRAAALWVQLNQTAHQQLVKVMSGQGGGAVTVTNGQVSINLGPFIKDIETNLSNHGFKLASKLPPINPSIALFQAKNLGRAQSAYRLINNLKWVLPLLTLLFLGLGIYAAKRRRRALLGASLGVVGAMFVLGAALAIARAIYLSSVPESTLPSDAAAALYDTLVRFIRDGLRLIGAIALIVAAVAFFTGPSRAAVSTRSALSSGAARLRRTSVLTSVRASGFGQWTAAHRRGLAIGSVAVAAFIFILWPGLSVAIVLAVILVLVLGFIELVGHPREPAPASPAS
jgi:hypothetical protein